MKPLKKLTAGVLFTGILLLTSGGVFAQQNPGKEKVQTEIEKSYAVFSQYMKDGNATGIAENLYTSDAKFYPPGGGLSSGRQEIESLLSQFIDSGINVNFETRELEVFGNMAYEYGLATITNNTDGMELDKNEYVVLWKKENGTWKIYRDFVKSSQEN